MGWSEPTDPTGTYDPAYMTNLYGAPFATNWNTCIYGSPMQTGANVLSNCVGYSQGRMLRIYMEDQGFNPVTAGYNPFGVFNGDAGTWLTIAANNGFDIVYEPQAGSVLVTPSHCAIVEKYENGLWWISESGYGDSNPFHYHNSLYQSGGTWYSSYASSPQVLGFVLIPDVTPGPGPSAGIIYDRKRRRDRYYYNEY